MVFRTVRVQMYGHACGAREFASVVLRWFSFVLERRDTSHCCLPNVSYSPPANVCLFSNAPPADWYVTQESTTSAFRRPYHAGEEPELARWLQALIHPLGCEGRYSRFQLELSTGTSTTFAEWHLSCRLMAVQSQSFPPPVQVIGRSAVLDISDRASIPCSLSNMFVLGVGGLVFDA